MKKKKNFKYYKYKYQLLHLWSGQLCGSIECHFQVLVGKKRLYSLSFQFAYLEEHRH